jgi:hypothetical protein
MTFDGAAWDGGVYVAGMFKGADGGAGITGGRGDIDAGCVGIPYMGGATGAAGGRPGAPMGGKATLG